MIPPMFNVEDACRDLGWRITCERSVTNNPEHVCVAWTINGHRPRARKVGLTMSTTSAAHAIREAWRSAGGTMGSRLVHRLDGTIEWDAETFSARNRWYLIDDSAPECRTAPMIAPGTHYGAGGYVEVIRTGQPLIVGILDWRLVYQQTGSSPSWHGAHAHSGHARG